MADGLGVNSWQSFHSRCGSFAPTTIRAIVDAETNPLADYGGILQPLDWTGLLLELQTKFQSFVSASLQKLRLEELRAV